MSADIPRRVSIAAPEFTQLPDLPDGSRPGTARIGSLVGAAGTGMSVYEVPPGQAISPYHYENPEEEWLVVLSASVYPDSNKIAIWTGIDDDIIVRRTSGVGYWDGESSRTS